MNVYSSNLVSASLGKCTVNKIRGVNLGGWLILERWMTPSLFANIPETYQGDWGYCEYLGKNACKKQMVSHWKTWITKRDLVFLYESGINLVRIPIGYWSLVPRPNEPFVQGAEAYFLKALQWAEEIGLKVMIDLHGHPGSQNGFDNSGKAGPIEWTKQKGALNHSLKVIKYIVDKYLIQFKNIIHSFEVVNEPANWGLDMIKLRQFYADSYQLIQESVPGTNVVFADAFLPFSYWDEFMQSYPNAIVDTHMYHVFDKSKLNYTHSDHIEYTNFNGKRLHNSTYPMLVGEWSIGTARCLTWQEGDCKYEDQLHNNTKNYHKFAKQLFLSQSQAYERNSKGWVFWSYKTENMTEWSYQASFKNNWIPLWSQCVDFETYQLNNFIPPTNTSPPKFNNLIY